MSMKNLLEKMTQLSKINETPAPPKKKVLKESAQVAPAKPSSLRELFNQLDEAMAPGQKPLPVLDPQNKQAGAGFVTSTNPTVQNMLKNLDPKDVQIVQAPGKPGQPMAPTAAGQPNPNQMAPTVGGTGQAMHEDELDEYFSYDKSKVPGRTGQQGPKDVLSLRGGRVIPKNDKEGYRDVVTGRKGGSFDAKKHYGAGGPKGVLPEGDLPSSSGVDTRGAGLGAGRSQSTFESKDSKDHKFEVCYTTTSDKEVKTTITASSVKEATAKVEKKHNFKSLDSVKKVKEEKKEVKEGTKGVNPFAKKDDKAPAKAPAKGKKPDFLDIDKDGDKKEPMKKAAAQAKPGTKGVNPFAKTDNKKKKTVKESMSHRMTAARLEGKAHGLKGHSHNGKHYEDMEEARCYHEGYKEGLDECHGMMPGMGLVGEAGMPPATTGGMASQAMPAMEDEFMEDEFEEGNAFTKALSRTPKGGKFKVAGNTFTDTSGYDAQLDEYTFESLDRQLDALLNEGVSVSISRGQENAPNSVTITAQDAEADELLALVRNAGMGGIFGGDEGSDDSFGMPNAPEIGGASEINAPGQIEVVDDHEGMLALMKKLAGNQSAAPTQDFGGDEEGSDDQGDMHSLMNKMSGGEEGSDDYEDEEGGSEECSSCGCADCECDGDEEKVDEVESEDQQEFEVAEDTGADNTDADVAGQVGSDEALATADAGEDEEEGEEDQAVQESQQVGRHWFAILDPDLVYKISELSGAEVDPDASTVETTNPKLAQQLTDYAAKNPTKLKVAQSSYVNKSRAEVQGGSFTPDDMVSKNLSEEDLTEWANDAGGNGTETTFEQDIDFMTNIISGGLNKKKSTGQTTIPVVNGQNDRMGYSAVNESISDWAKLAGIRKN